MDKDGDFHYSISKILFIGKAVFKITYKTKTRIFKIPHKIFLNYFHSVYLNHAKTKQNVLNSNNTRWKVTEIQLSIRHNCHLLRPQHRKLNSSSFNKTANLYDNGRNRPIKLLKNEGGAVSSSVSTRNSCYREHMAELRATLYYVPGTSTTLKFKVLKTKDSFWCPETVQFVPVQSNSVQCTSVESIRKICVLIIVVKCSYYIIKTNNQKK
jgi:hypothetical protein